MDSKRIINFLQQIRENNNRSWFQLHKDEYLACKKDFEKGVALGATHVRVGSALFGERA